MKTRIINSFKGWMGETFISANGYYWNVATCKRNNGQIVSIATAGEKTENTFSFSFGNPSVNLLTTKGRATEKTIKEAHYKALAIFEEMQEAGTLPVNKNAGYEIKRGQILFLNGYGQDENSHERKAVYEIEKNSFGTLYKCVNLDTLELHVIDRPRNISEKFGIGHYYKEGDIIDDDTLSNALIEAKKREADKERKKQSEKLLNEAAIAAKIEEGKKLVNIPAWAQSVIVAELYQDDSDSMTDYFSTSVIKTVYLSFSKTKRNNMNELKQACLNFEETKEFSEGGENLEHTDGSYYLPDYYLGTKRWFGWKVCKKKYLNLTSEDVKKQIYIAAAEGRYFVKEQKETVSNGIIELIQYSDKAIAVTGDTRTIKEELKAIGGRFNARLTDPKTGNKFMGWVFQKCKEEKVKNLLNL